MKIPRRRAIPASVSTASMADIAFLLLIFFMVTTVFDVDKSAVDLPSSITQDELEHGAAVVVVAADPARPGEHEVLFTNGDDESRAVRLEDLPRLVESAMERFVTAGRTHLFVVKADANAPYRAVDEVIQHLRDGGASNIFLLTRPRVSGT